MQREQHHTGRLVAGRYRLGDLLGSGGVAEVRQAWDVTLNRRVAVKLLFAGTRDEMKALERMEIEARAAARLNHRHVVAVYDMGVDDGLAFIVMECLPGRTVADLISRGPAEQAWVNIMAEQVLGALGTAHRAGIVHRDIKPGNLLMADDGAVKVADFGIAKAQQDVSLTATGLLVGTPAYMAPECVEGGVADARSDLYSLGVVMYEALTGAKPFNGENPLAVAYAVRHSDPVRLAERRPDIDPALAGVVERAMSKDPLERFSSADEMLEALVGNPNASSAPIVATVPPDGQAPTDVLTRGETVQFVQPPPQRGPRIQTWRMVAIVASVASVAVLALVLALGPRAGDAGSEGPPSGQVPATQPEGAVSQEAETAPGEPAPAPDGAAEAEGDGLPAELEDALDRLERSVRR